MDEPGLHGCAGVAVQEGVEGVITDESAGGVGDLARETCVSDGLSHVGHGDGGEIGRGAVGGDGDLGGLVALVIGDPGVPEIDGNPFWGDGGTSAGLTDAEDHIGVDFLGDFQHGLGCEAEDGGNFQLMYMEVADGVRQELYGFPCGVDGLAAEGVETGDEQSLFHNQHLKWR